MGLDITAYSNLQSVGDHTEGWCEDEDHVSAYAYMEFPDSFRGIPVLAAKPAFSGDYAFLWGGCYALTERTQTHSFRAGSYSGYGEWREDLRQQFNFSRHTGSPFYELIWFADNEGCIGPLAARDLLEDFRIYADKYVDPADGWGRQKYTDWTRACELAAESGLIQFH